LKQNKSIILIAAWCLYDWACSSFSVIVVTFIFATYFTTHIAKNEIVGTFQWANATALAGIVIALASPLFGSIADYGGHHKRWLLFFTLMCITSSALLWFAYPNTYSVSLTLMCLIFGTIGLEIAMVFYNALLSQLAPKEYVGRISGWGWGAGYIGGIVSLTLALIFFVKTNLFSLDTQTFAQIRISGPFVAIWYFIFSLPLFFFMPVPNSLASRPLLQAIRAGCLELYATFKMLVHEKNILLFLIAHMIYADGLNTIFVFGGIYAAGTYGLSFQEVLMFGITMNITAGIGAILLGWMDDWVGSKETILVSLLFLVLLGVPLLFLHHKYAFWAVALMLCVFVGPVQSASRSLMIRLMDSKKMSTEMFGLYALSGKITAFVGPWLLGWMTLIFKSQRVGMATVLTFFIIGGILLLPVKIKNS